MSQAFNSVVAAAMDGALQAGPESGGQVWRDIVDAGVRVPLRLEAARVASEVAAGLGGWLGGGVVAGLDGLVEEHALALIGYGDLLDGVAASQEQERFEAALTPERVEHVVAVELNHLVSGVTVLVAGLLRFPAGSEVGGLVAAGGGGFPVYESKGAATVEQGVGVPLLLVWLTVGDNRVRNAHAALEGVESTVGPAGRSSFWVMDGWVARYPGDPNLPAYLRVNCRCRVSPVGGPVVPPVFPPDVDPDGPDVAPDGPDVVPPVFPPDVAPVVPPVFPGGVSAKDFGGGVAVVGGDLVVSEGVPWWLLLVFVGGVALGDQLERRGGDTRLDLLPTGTVVSGDEHGVIVERVDDDGERVVWDVGAVDSDTGFVWVERRVSTVDDASVDLWWREQGAVGFTTTASGDVLADMGFSWAVTLDVTVLRTMLVSLGATMLVDRIDVLSDRYSGQVEAMVNDPLFPQPQDIVVLDGGRELLTQKVFDGVRGVGAG